MGDFNLSEVAKDLIINIINILVLFVVVKMLVYKPVKNFLEARKTRVENATKEAELKAAEAQKTLDARDSIIAEGEKTAQKAHDDAIEKATAEAAEITAEAKAKSGEILAAAKQQADAEKKRAIESAKGEICALATDMTAKILEREVNASDNEKAVEEFLKELGEQ